MLFLTGVLSFVVGIALVMLIHRAKSPRDHRILSTLYFLLLCCAGGLLISAALGMSWRPEPQLSAFIFVSVFWVRQCLRASFWGKAFYQTLFVVHLALGGYLYSATQLPHADKPFAEVSGNQPRPLVASEYPRMLVAGIPGGGNASSSTDEGDTAPPRKVGVLPHRTGGPALQWGELDQFMMQDSQIRHVLQPLKEQQERQLSDFLAQLNVTSVTGTNMRRRAIPQANVDDLLKERAISESRYRTIVETWSLLDHDEEAFRARQADELFNALLELLADNKVDESHKVEFIRFMVSRFPHDVRLVKPLIDIYDQLDDEYPRQKRLNQDFLRLYLAKRSAVLDGFKVMGELARQPLLDYRRKTISHITYSQARLDGFLRTTFAATVRPLYGAVPPQSIPDFLNRAKYPDLGKLSGASFKQEYVRRHLIKLAEENHAPAAPGPIMGLDEVTYRELIDAQQDNQGDSIDHLIIHQDPSVRANVAWHLAARKDPYSIPLIFELMRDADPEVRRLAAIAMGNFRIVDTQGSNDPKFTEIVRMLQNYRSNADAFGRAWAVLGLATVGDRQKALYVIDLLLNDGALANSVLGDAAPAWRSDEEKGAVKSLVEMLKQTPEELSVKTQALNALIAIDSAETLDVLLHYLEHTYQSYHTHPTLWRYLVPHMSLPQEAENVEDVAYYLAGREQSLSAERQERHLKALHVHLRRAYEDLRAGEFFQLLHFLKAFDPAEYQSYVEQTPEQIRIMCVTEYVVATGWVWLVFWPVSFIALMAFSYGAPSVFNLDMTAGQGRKPAPNRRSNPASDTRQTTLAPPAAIVPIKIVNSK